MELNRVKEIIDKYAVPVFPADITWEEWCTAKRIVLEILNCQEATDVEYEIEKENN